MPDEIVFGAFASIRIRHSGDIYQLVAKIRHALIIENLSIEIDEYPPHEELGTFEMMGWEGWLIKDPEMGDNWFKFRMETVDCFKEIFNDRMYDLSPWLARMVTTLCKMETRIHP